MFTTVMSRMIMSWALSMMARAIPGRPEPRRGDPAGLPASRPANPLTPLTPLAPSAPSGACEEDKMPPWLSISGRPRSGRPRRWAIDLALPAVVLPTMMMDHRYKYGGPPVADRPLAGRYYQE